MFRWGTLTKMQLMLRKASNTLYVNGKMTFDQMHNYRMAVTEREVINGCLSVGPNHKYWYLCFTLKRIMNEQSLRDFYILVILHYIWQNIYMHID